MKDKYVPCCYNCLAYKNWFPYEEPSKQPVDCCFWEGGKKGSPKGCSGEGRWRKAKATPELLERITKREAKQEKHDMEQELKQLKERRLPDARMKKTTDNKDNEALIKKIRDRIGVLETNLSLTP